MFRHEGFFTLENTRTISRSSINYPFPLPEIPEVEYPEGEPNRDNAPDPNIIYNNIIQIYDYQNTPINLHSAKRNDFFLTVDKRTLRLTNDRVSGNLILYYNYPGPTIPKGWYWINRIVYPSGPLYEYNQIAYTQFDKVELGRFLVSNIYDTFTDENLVTIHLLDTVDYFNLNVSLYTTKIASQVVYYDLTLLNTTLETLEFRNRIGFPFSTLFLNNLYLYNPVTSDYKKYLDGVESILYTIPGNNTTNPEQDSFTLSVAPYQPVTKPESYRLINDLKYGKFKQYQERRVFKYHNRIKVLPQITATYLYYKKKYDNLIENKFPILEGDYFYQLLEPNYLLGKAQYTTNLDILLAPTRPFRNANDSYLYRLYNNKDTTLVEWNPDGQHCKLAEAMHLRIDDVKTPSITSFSFLPEKVDCSVRPRKLNEPIGILTQREYSDRFNRSNDYATSLDTLGNYYNKSNLMLDFRHDATEIAESPNRTLTRKMANSIIPNTVVTKPTFNGKYVLGYNVLSPNGNYFISNDGWLLSYPGETLPRFYDEGSMEPSYDRGRKNTEAVITRYNPTFFLNPSRTVEQLLEVPKTYTYRKRVLPVAPVTTVLTTVDTEYIGGVDYVGTYDDLTVGATGYTFISAVPPFYRMRTNDAFLAAKYNRILVGMLGPTPVTTEEYTGEIAVVYRSQSIRDTDNTLDLEVSDTPWILSDNLELTSSFNLGSSLYPFPSPKTTSTKLQKFTAPSYTQGTTYRLLGTRKKVYGAQLINTVPGIGTPFIQMPYFYKKDIRYYYNKTIVTNSYALIELRYRQYEVISDTDSAFETSKTDNGNDVLYTSITLTPVYL